MAFNALVGSLCCCAENNLGGVTARRPAGKAIVLTQLRDDGAFYEGTSNDFGEAEVPGTL